MLPILMTLVLGGADFSRIVYDYIAVSNASRVGAEYGATHRFTAYSRSSWESRVQQAVVAEMASSSAFDPTKLAVAISAVSWGGECVAFFLVLYGLGFPASAHLMFVAVSTLGISTLIGAISLLPGGLGAAELSVTGLLIIFIGGANIDHETAAAATLLIRLSTFWFGILIGLGALLISEWYLKRVEQARPAPG